MLIADLFFVGVSWWLAYWIRFNTGFLPEPEDHELHHYLIGWAAILCVWTIVFRLVDIYRPRRISYRQELFDLFRASLLALLTFLGVVFLVHEVVLSRLVVLMFWGISLFLLNLSHLVFRKFYGDVID